MAKKKKIDAYAKSLYVWAIARIGLGLILLWAFVDKLLGLGFATCRDANSGAVEVMCQKAWLNGGSPTTGFLNFATDGPLASFYKDLAGNTAIDWLFMLGLLLIGLALVSGIGVRVAAVTGSLLFLMMWSAVLPPENNPVLDDHIIYIIVLAGIAVTNKDQKLGLGKWWQSQSVVKRFPIIA